MRYRRRIGTPTVADVEAMAELDGIALREGEAADLLETIRAIVAAAGCAEDRDGARAPAPVGPRDPGTRATPEDDPYNAFVRRCRVEGAGDGPLAGFTVADKNTLAGAGGPMTEAPSSRGGTPPEDAAAAERPPPAGETIVGTLNRDEPGGGATGAMSSIGPPRTPADPAYSAGGS